MAFLKTSLSSLMTKKTRFKTAMVLCLFCMALTVYALNKGSETVAGQALAALMVIAPAYILGDSYRKSDASKTE
tara:strand:- start:6502 stop:6723 length:222 start_codon:yes stop_codon:yes gene_type:complete